MCIIFVAVQQHPDFPLIFAANRDEFHGRPTRPSHLWRQPNILAGRDLSAGGTWLGANGSGHLAAITNIRTPAPPIPQARSRGELPVHYLTAPRDDEFLDNIRAQRKLYNGYNLLFGHHRRLQVFNNHLNTVEPLTPGVHGLSNANLNTPWPKVQRGTRALTSICQTHTTLQHDALFDILRDDTLADDDQLPQTGLPLEFERRVSSIFILGEHYGTRASTLLLVDARHTLHWHERSFTPQGKIAHETRISWQLAPTHSPLSNKA